MKSSWLFLLIHLCRTSLAFDTLPSRSRQSSRLVRRSANGNEGTVITVALTGDQHQGVLQQKMAAHPLLSILEANTEFVHMPCTQTSPDVAFFEQTVESVDIACFASPAAVHAWLATHDCAVGIEADDGSKQETPPPKGNGNVLAACIGSETARVCLETGRWPAHNIYYPPGADNLQGWADSAVQAAADLMEARFWE